MPKKSMATAVPRPRECSVCHANKFTFWGKRVGEDGSVRGYLWKCEVCQEIEFVERRKPKPRKKK